MEFAKAFVANTILVFFAQNLGDAYREDIVQDDRIVVPAGAGRVAFFDVRDLAEVAVNALVDPNQHQGQIYLFISASYFLALV